MLCLVRSVVWNSSYLEEPANTMKIKPSILLCFLFASSHATEPPAALSQHRRISTLPQGPLGQITSRLRIRKSCSSLVGRGQPQMRSNFVTFLDSDKTREYLEP